MTSLSEFIVQKITNRHPEPTKRILCLTEATVLERDPQTYSVSIFKEKNTTKSLTGSAFDICFVIFVILF